MKPEELAPVMYAAMARAVADWGIEVPGWDDVTCANTGDLAAVRDGWLAAAREAVGQLAAQEAATPGQAAYEIVAVPDGQAAALRPPMAATVVVAARTGIPGHARQHMRAAFAADGLSVVFVETADAIAAIPPAPAPSRAKLIADRENLRARLRQAEAERDAARGLRILRGEGIEVADDEELAAIIAAVLAGDAPRHAPDDEIGERMAEAWRQGLEDGTDG